jgi:hypothetical protein
MRVASTCSTVMSTGSRSRFCDGLSIAVTGFLARLQWRTARFMTPQSNARVLTIVARPIPLCSRSAAKRSTMPARTRASSAQLESLGAAPGATRAEMTAARGA